MKQTVKTILVVGTGTMGGGIAQVSANSGDTVFLYDKAPGAAEQTKQRIAQSLERAAAKGYVNAEDVKRTLGNLHPVATIEAATNIDAVVEAVKEDLEIKRAVFAELEAIVGAETLLWTNTSMISITKIAHGLHRPERVAGTHFFNPVPRMKLVEIIPGKATCAETVRIAQETVSRWGKTPVLAPDTPGFIVNRLWDAFARETLALHEEGVPKEAIDTAVRLGLNFPMGPIELMDMIGLDTMHDCFVSQDKGMGRPANVSPTLCRLLQEGKRGCKTGEGFYKY